METISLTERALECLPELPDKSLRLLIGHLRNRERYNEADHAVDQLEQRTGPTGMVMDHRAQILECRGEIEAARALRQQRCRDFPDATAWIQMARHAIDFSAPDTVLGAVDRELAAQDASSIDLEMARCEIALARGRVDDAMTLAMTLYESSPRSSRPGLMLARLALMTGDDKAAVRHLDEVARKFGQRTAQADVERLLREMDGVENQQIGTLANALRRPLPEDRQLHDELEEFFHPTLEEPAIAISPPLEEDTDARVLQTLQDVFGYDELRPGQAEVINRILAGSDTLAIMPTGAGKSLTFQIPALHLGAPVLVISPLIALMQDQLEGLPRPIRENATFVNSSLSSEEMERRKELIRRGEAKLIYAAPERLRQSEFLDLLRSVGVGLVAIDEAHCVSMWGHDFRPDYFFITRALEELGDPPVLAITATATPVMARQIAESLQRPLHEIRTSAYRENLTYSVIRSDNKDAKLRELERLCKSETGSTIIYVQTRRDADDFAALLVQRGCRAVPYHAGLAKEVRARNQRAFLNDQAQIIVATIAFGMGINKPNVRLIVHFGPSSSLEAYIQESGRAGRDGESSRCILLASSNDGGTLRRRANQNRIMIDELRDVYKRLRTMAVGNWVLMDRTAAAELAHDQTSSAVSIGLLEQAGFVRRHMDVGRAITIRWGQRSAESDATNERDRFGQWLGRIAAGSSIITVPTAVACDELDCSPAVLERALRSQIGVTATFGYQSVCLELLPVSETRTREVQKLLDQLHEREMQRVDEIVAYLNGRACRHVHLAKHVGEAIEPCGQSCDICTGGSEVKSVDRRKLRLGDPYYAALVTWRRERARSMTQPAFVVASDRLLESLASIRPTSIQELVRIKGIGQIKAELYGNEIISVVRQVADQERKSAR
jgi:ATP-dependent DNA helicase RecQ